MKVMRELAIGMPRKMQLRMAQYNMALREISY